MDMLKYKDVIEEGDLVMIYLSIKNLYPLVMKKGEVFQNKYGALKHEDVIGKKYGSIVHCSRGWVYALFPTPELWTITLPHRTQILYASDISIITLQLDLKPGSVVCEAGTGSGSLSHAVARTISPNGMLYTFDFHQQRVEIAEKEFKSHGLSKIVQVQERDVSKNGFGMMHVADAIILDLPQPWEVIPFVRDCIKLSGGRVCSFSPCVEQVQRTCTALRANNFHDVTTIECIPRQFEVKKVTLPTLKSNSVVTRPSKKCDVMSDNSMDIDIQPEISSSEEQHACDNLKDNNTSTNETFWTAIPPLQAPGHTGYLTFATILRCVDEEIKCEKVIKCEKEIKCETNTS